MELEFYSKEYFEEMLRLHVIARYDVSVKKREEHDDLIRVIREGKDISNEGKLKLYSEVYGREDYAD